MSSTTQKNEMIKRKFYKYLAGPKQSSPATVECYEDAIYLWEDFTNKADFSGFTQTKAEDFKEWLKNKKKARSEGNVSLSYCYDILRHLQTFFEWLSEESGYKQKIKRADVEYLKLSKKEVQMATQPKNKSSPTFEEVKSVIESIKGDTEIEMRDRALISLTLLTGIRILALSSLPIKSFDKEKYILDQDPNFGVKTKFSKRIVSAFIPFPYKKPSEHFIKWIDYLETEKKFGPNDPIFPATKVGVGKENLGYYNTQEVEPVFWKGSSSARKIFEKRFLQAGVKYYHPHTFRDLLVKEISKLPLTEEQKKAFSQNLGHEDVGTTFGSYGYGNISQDRQIEIMKDIDFEGKNRKTVIQIDEDNMDDFVAKMAKK